MELLCCGFALSSVDLHRLRFECSTAGRLQPCDRGVPAIITEPHKQTEHWCFQLKRHRKLQASRRDTFTQLEAARAMPRNMKNLAIKLVCERSVNVNFMLLVRPFSSLKTQHTFHHSFDYERTFIALSLSFC